ncbi:MAG TPA: DEAD/DEAH box helicase [Crocinitomicaceae bacterium]|nr:DEAD/DEAH box helicase [Crocinitomicaceae bacterium]
MNKKQLQSFLRNAGHSEMMKIQEDAVEAIQKIDNLILYSKTGSGKTLAFLFAILAKMEADSNELEAIILAPSRELTIQIEEVFRSLKTGKKITVCYGGHSVKTEENSLSQFPNIVVGTPGRIVDHIHRRNLDLRSCPMIVIDEFDKCLEFGFGEEMGFISERMRGLQQRMLVSATKMDEIPEYLDADYHVIDALKENDEIAVTEHLVHSGKNILRSLAILIESFENEKAIVFCNYREVSEDVSFRLDDLGVTSVFYHGGLEQVDRERALIKFRNGTSNVLVCTDLGSRGLDIPEINHIIHYQYPNSEEAFTHRKGRTARMSASGHSYLFFGEETQLPEYIEEPTSKINTNDLKTNPVVPEWTTIYFSAGKKDKVNKIDFVGFLSKKGMLKKDEIGLITVQDRMSFVAIKRDLVSQLLKRIHNEKVKGKKLKIDIAR